MKRHFQVLIVLFFLKTSAMPAQDAMTKLQNGADLNVVYRNEADLNLYTHSQGFGIGFRRAFHVTASRKKVFEIEGCNMSSPKQTRINNPRSQDAKAYSYGLLNNFFVLRGGFGFQRVLFRKADRKSVEIRLGSYYGVLLGILKPVYLDVFVNSGASPGNIFGSNLGYTAVKANPNDPNQYQDNIYGAAPFLTGIDQLSIVPGAYVKMGLSFEFGESRTEVKAIETGVTVDAFPVVIQQMAGTQNYQVFPTVYLAVIFGKKWF